MLFHEHIFLYFFLPVTLALYYLLPRRLARTSLLLASFAFYAYWRFWVLGVLLASIAFNFVLARSIFSAKRGKRVLLIGGVAVNLLALAFFKYFYFVVDTLGLEIALPFTVVLPIGISFHTFQQIAYIVDVYRGFAPYQRIKRYSLFVSFFPQLVAGPIVRHQEVMGQFDRPRRFGTIATLLGINLFLIGLAKKVVIADTFATFSSPVFADAIAGPPTQSSAVAAMLAFAMQIYFDFSGYSDMALGLALLFGIRLPLNFAAPYGATSIIDFWRRWHITLSRFLRDFLYIPLGGNRKGPARRWLNLMLTMLLGGLWHGASWTFVAWGGLHGLYLAINHLWREVAPRAPPRWALLTAAASWCLTFLAVVHAWVFFKAETFPSAWNILSAAWGVAGGNVAPAQEGVPTAPFVRLFLMSAEANSMPLQSYLTQYFWWLLPLALFLSVQRHHSMLIARALTAYVAKSSPPLQLAWCAAAVLVVYVCSILVSDNVSEFIYFQF